MIILRHEAWRFSDGLAFYLAGRDAEAVHAGRANANMSSMPRATKKPYRRTMITKAGVSTGLRPSGLKTIPRLSWSGSWSNIPTMPNYDA